MKEFLGRFFVGKKRKALLSEFAELLMEIPKVKTLTDCFDGYRRVGDFTGKLSRDKKDLPLKSMCGKMIEYLTDTKEHITKGYHKPAHNGWNVVRVYPDINDYVNMGFRIKPF